MQRVQLWVSSTSIYADAPNIAVHTNEYEVIKASNLTDESLNELHVKSDVRTNWIQTTLEDSRDSPDYPHRHTSLTHTSLHQAYVNMCEVFNICSWLQAVASESTTSQQAHCLLITLAVSCILQVLQSAYPYLACGSQPAVQRYNMLYSV